MASVLEERYLEIKASVDAEFRRNRLLHGEKIHCRPGCSDCCYHLFQITEIDAACIAKGLERMARDARGALRERAREYLRAYQAQTGTNGGRDVFRGPSRIPCPALERGVCSIYEFRPLMCHKFGMPLYNPDKPDRIFACELNFKNGEEIQDPDLIQIQTGIHEAWKRLQADYADATGQPQRRPLTVAHAILQDE